MLLNHIWYVHIGFVHLLQYYGISMFKLLQYGTITAGVKATVSHYVILVFKACFGIPQ